jgi:tRNA (cmo5U34)-methyltransferase
MSTASRYFGAMVTEYDSLIRRAVPRYDEMLARAVEYMPARATRVLELGCGTGNLSLAVAARFPDAELVLVDGSAEMLALTRHRLEAQHPGRDVACVESRFEDLELAPAAFDLVTSSISLHHVVDKAAFLRGVRAWLAPGGSLVYTDQMRGRTDAHHALNMERMHDFWRLPEHLTPDEHAHLDAHADAHDHYASVPDQLAWLAAAGFRDVDCVWRNWMWGILTARAGR